MPEFHEALTAPKKEKKRYPPPRGTCYLCMRRHLLLISRGRCSTCWRRQEGFVQVGGRNVRRASLNEEDLKRRVGGKIVDVEQFWPKEEKSG